jgi:hypothetical protein
MARRRIGQEQLRVIIDDQAGARALDQIAGPIEWSEIDRQLVDIYAAPKGEHGWPPLALFRAMLLAVWHDLSDVKLAEALADRASFRRFCGFSACEPTPERTAFARFRAELVARGAPQSQAGPWLQGACRDRPRRRPDLRCRGYQRQRARRRAVGCGAAGRGGRWVWRQRVQRQPRPGDDRGARWQGAHRADGHLGRRGGLQAATGVQCRGVARARAD